MDSPDYPAYLKVNNAWTAEARRLINQREARSTFYDAAETVDQMIAYEKSLNGRMHSGFFLQTQLLSIEEETGEYYLRKIYFSNQRANR